MGRIVTCHVPGDYSPPAFDAGTYPSRRDCEKASGGCRATTARTTDLHVHAVTDCRKFTSELPSEFSRCQTVYVTPT